MAAVRSAATKIEWATLAPKLGLRGSTANALTSFKKRNDDARRRVQVLSDQPQSVDFAQYREVLKNTKVIDEMEAQVKGFKPQSYDVGKQIKGIETFEAQAIKSATETAAAVDSELKDLATTLKNIESARPFEDMTVDDVMAAEPSIEKKVEHHVKNHRWMPAGYKEKFGDLSVL